MNSVSTLICFIALLYSQSCAVKVDEVSKLVQNLLENERVPSVLAAITCWTKSDSIHFLKASKIPVQFTQFKIPSERLDDKTNKLWHFIDMNCSGSYAFLSTLNASHFGHPNRWIVLEPDEQRLTTMPFLVNSNIIFINFNAESDRFDLNQVYKIDKNQTDLISERFAHWSSQSGLIDLRETSILSRRRRNLMGKVLKSVMIVTRNETTDLNDVKNYEIDFPSKVGYSITNLLVESMNASVSYSYVNTWGYGDMKHPEKLKGMVGPLIRNEIDIGGVVLFITSDRIPFLEYLSVTLPVKFGFVLRAPPLSYVSNIYYLPFSTVVWICGIVLVIVSTAIVYVTYRVSKEKIEHLMATDFLLFATSTVCQMGSNLILKKSSGRIATLKSLSALFVFCLSLIFMYTSYTANIVALLQSTTQNIRTPSDLLNYDIQLGVEDTPYARHYFTTATEPIHRKIYETKIAPQNVRPRFHNVSHGVSMMRKGLYAFHMELATGYKSVKETFYEHEKCGLIEIDFFKQNHPMHVAPKNSPYKEIFKIGLFKLREHGIQTREIGRRSTEKPICNSHSPYFESVRINDCYAAFLVFCYGIAAALFLLCIESVWLKCKPKSQDFRLFNRK